MDISLRRAVTDAKLALIMDDKERVPLSRTNKALLNLLAAVEQTHPDGRPTGTVYVVISGNVDLDELMEVEVLNQRPVCADDLVHCVQVTIGTMDAVIVDASTR
jgi:hypothetical protein